LPLLLDVPGKRVRKEQMLMVRASLRRRVLTP
jgi:hypothetical protein